MINKFKTFAAGFTLIETLLAVLLLTTAIAGPLTIASKGLTSSLVAKDQITAFYLAQDAMEYIRFKRDSNCLAAAAAPGACPSGTWLSGLVGSGLCSADGATTCYLDSMENNPATPTGCSGTCPVMYFDGRFGYYNYDSTNGTQTPQRFIRTVRITTPYGGNNDEAKVEISVSWITGGVPRVIVVRENIENWQ